MLNGAVKLVPSGWQTGSAEARVGGCCDMQASTLRDDRWWCEVQVMGFCLGLTRDGAPRLVGRLPGPRLESRPLAVAGLVA